MKRKWFYILMLCIGCLSMTSCLDDLFGDDDEESGLSLFCGSALPSGYQCISPLPGAKQLTTYEIPELYGTWHSDGFDFCVQYNGDGTGKIIAIASGLHPGSEMNIKWGVMVNSDGSYAQSDGNGSVRVIHEGIGEAVDPQIAMLTFKIPTKQFYGFDLVRVSSCPKGSGGGAGTGNTGGTGNNPGTGNNGTGGGNSGTGGNSGNTGNVIFWLGSDGGCGAITVKISTGQQGSITHYYDSMPSCGASGSANFTLPAGKYSFTASCSKYQWSGDFTVVKDGCHPLKLNISN